MKIAIPTKNNQVDSHFGHCEYYTIAEVEGNKLVSKTRFNSPEGCGCKSDVAADLRAMGVEILLAGNMGQGAVNKIETEKIKVIRGCAGDVDIVLNSYLSGLVFDSGLTCSTHGDGDHVCSH